MQNRNIESGYRGDRNDPIDGTARGNEQIMRSPASEARNYALSNLIDKVKAEFNVPLLRNPEWEQNNPAIIAFYRKIGMSRTSF